MIGFKSVQLFKDQTLGIGSYGKVCRAKCDELICAAKLIHETLFDPMALFQIAPQREHRLPFRRFQQEGDFLSTIRHPNIILYLGMHRDDDTGLPVLLMELMDDSLTHYLESSTQPIPYHIQVNICHDIALALSFLHSNDIIHRDLSSNNVLLRGNFLAKVTDFGMARLGDINPQGAHFTSTTCPGTDVYMPPEAVKDKPVYTEKIDCFSFGVVTLQILTRLFPKPGDRMQEVELNHPGLPRGTLMLRLPEVDRRRDHIDKVDPHHPLLSVVLDCLKDDDSQRPSAEQLCERIASLKETGQYRDARDRMNGGTGEQGQSTLEDIQLPRDQLEEKDRSLRQKDLAIATKDQQLRQQGEEIESLNRDNQRLEREKSEKERQLNRVNHQLEESERVVADFERRVVELEGGLRQRDQPQIQGRGAQSRAHGEAVIKLRWREGEKDPCRMDRWCDAAVGGGVVYYREFVSIHAYNTTTSNWSLIPDCPVYTGFALAVINDTLTTVGGYGKDTKDTDKLFSLTGAGEDGVESWREEFPPMPTKRYQVSALCIGTALIVVGGRKGNDVDLKTVEVLNTSTRQWHTATDLPQPLSTFSMAVCGDRIYLLGGNDKDNKWTQSVYSCSLTFLLMSLGGRIARALSRSSSSGTWTREADLPVSACTAVSLHGQLIAVGGWDSNGKRTTDIRRYDPSTNTWEVISHMATPRSRCLAAVLPDNQLMVVGGWMSDDAETKSVEFARVS